MFRLTHTPRRPLKLLMIVVLLAGCATDVERHYETALSGGASLERRSLQSVIEERERYAIFAPSHDADEEALRQCGLPHSSGGEPPFQPTPSLLAPRGPQEIKIERRGDTYRVPVRINDTITLPFLLDTGASALVIPADLALTLMRAGALTSGDFVGKSRYQLANGSEEVSDLIVLREVQVGEHAIRNVTATISPVRGEPLLGQSFLSKFGTVTLDYKRLVLILSR